MKQLRSRPLALVFAVLITPLALAALMAATKITHGAGKGEEEKEKFDPVKVNGKFFENWKKPDLAILITGKQDGYLEPCGCAGLENQKGGLKRRFTFLKGLRDKGWNEAIRANMQLYELQPVNADRK